MEKMGMQAIDLAIQNGVALDGTPIPQKMLEPVLTHLFLIDF